MSLPLPECRSRHIAISRMCFGQLRKQHRGLNARRGLSDLFNAGYLPLYGRRLGCAAKREQPDMAMSWPNGSRVFRGNGKALVDLARAAHVRDGVSVDDQAAREALRDTLFSATTLQGQARSGG